ncbi:MAG TPA: translation initiation factor [Bacteroidetes bacterium]|nr:translation initiation factor [Bacteroidota bacterium]
MAGTHDGENPFDVLKNIEFSEQDLKESEIQNQKPEVEELDLSFRKNAKLRVWLEKKKRKGKPVSVISGFDPEYEDLKELAKMLKIKLGVGGSASEDTIMIQGQSRDKIIEILLSLGYKDVKKAGG